MKKILIVWAILISAVSLHAAVDGTLALSPAVVMLSGERGQSTRQRLTLRNGTSRQFEFELVAEDVIVKDGARQQVEAGVLPGSIAATAVFSERKVVVPPASALSVNVTLTLPKNADGRAVVVLFRGTNTVMSGNVPMTASLGALMTFTLSDAVELTADDLKVQPQTSSANLAVSQLCTNSGTEPLVAKGVLAILDANGALVGKAALQPQRLLPRESATLGGEYAGELQPGKYRVVVTFEYEGRNLIRSTEVEVL